MITKKSPLNARTFETTDGLSMQEIPAVHVIDLRVAADSPGRVGIINALGIALPGKPGQSSIISSNPSAFKAVLCLAADSWLLVGFPDGMAMLKTLSEKNEAHFSAVDVSDQRTTIELSGSKAREWLAHLWEQDLRVKNFSTGQLSQGLMAKAPVILWQVAEFRYRVMVRSSFALHVWLALEDAVAEWV